MTGGKRVVGALRGGSYYSHQSLLVVSCWIGSWSWSGSRRRFRSNSTWSGWTRREREGGAKNMRSVCGEWYETRFLYSCYKSKYWTVKRVNHQCNCSVHFTLQNIQLSPSNCTSAISSFSLLYFSMSKRVLFTPLWKNSRYCLSLASG